MSPYPADTLEREIRIAARPEIVFAFFTDPARMIRWKGMSATLDARPGGLYRVNINGRDVVRGKFVVVTPHSRIVFTWGWEGSPLPPGATTVEVSLAPDNGATIVRLRHRGLPPDMLSLHESGWDHYLPRLAALAEGRDPGPDPRANAGHLPA